jgi:hypothetical protein
MLALAVRATEVGERVQVDVSDVLDDDLEAASFIGISCAFFGQCDDDLVLHDVRASVYIESVLTFVPGGPSIGKGMGVNAFLRPSNALRSKRRESRLLTQLGKAQPKVLELRA